MSSLNPWSQGILNLIRRLNNFRSGQLVSQCTPFLVDGIPVGTISPYVLPHLEKHTDVFKLVRNDDGGIGHVTLDSNLQTFEQRTKKVDDVMQEFRRKDLFLTLKGWRDEMYAVSRSFYEKPLLKVERSAACLLGVIQYGVHLNGYYKNDKGDLYMWVGRRSLTKQTYPGMLDQVVAGGISCGMGVKETLVKECAEEASIPENLANQAIPCGTVSYCLDNERGIFPELQFVYDLVLPTDFIPTPNDKEVSEFYCWPINKVKEMIVTDEFKPNCALVILDFLIRHGVISADTEQYYTDFVSGCHQTPLDQW
ncbi:nudix hydrolase 20, chloroplastic-like [Actinia tenebrosa]|uniref:Nudix hydrolase 20, chloroplastic-like n=1 Tax=Actinia tenebrosa TaxID=6105 RepID=A0A6P8IXL4_ACTTE|nr:nudix hydrolase 20, chloroplastic-like [Actinia tenebrosa]XP_031570666.1 nudix hydrolase 20, chloroplastic-like [Actinia tenebrosa]